MFGTEFQLSSDAADVVIFLYLVLRFGFTGSPGIFGRLMQGVQFSHRPFSPSDTLWDASTPLCAEVFVDDGMFLEAKIGQRMELSTNVWGNGSDLILGDGSISKKKLSSEWTWETKLVLLGYMADLEEDTISLPDSKILGAVNLIQSPEFNPGCRTLTLHSAQELRGCSNHWSKTGRVWNWLTEPVNQMLACVDSENIWIRCGDWGKWTAFRSVIQFILDLSADQVLWRTLLTGCFSELVGVRSGPPYPSLLIPTYGFQGMRPLPVSGGGWV